MARIQISDLGNSEDDALADGNGYLRDLTDTELNHAIGGNQPAPNPKLAELAKSLGLELDDFIRLLKSNPST
jgi:hypothetical protein